MICLYVFMSGWERKQVCHVYCYGLMCRKSMLLIYENQYYCYVQGKVAVIKLAHASGTFKYLFHGIVVLLIAHGYGMETIRCSSFAAHSFS